MAKSSLCATDFDEFHGDVTQAFPKCYLMGTHEVDQDQVDRLISYLRKINQRNSMV